MDWDYAPAPESAAIGRLRDRYQMFVGGRFVDGRGDDVKTINPATEEALASVSTAGTADVDDAVAAARTAYDEVWSRISPAERGKYLYRIARGIAERARELAVVETLDNGKPIKESRDVDVPTAAAHFFYHAGWADKLQHAGFGPAPASLGVAGQVIPWNFPLLMAAWKIAPALAAGNTVVIKPAETTPLSILVLAEIIADADLPPGVVNIITGAGDIGAALVNHPGIDKVAFTGSTEVGKQIQASLAGTGRKITLELGGKAANIVFDDAPIDQAVEGIVNGIFFNQGHVCCAGSRLLVQESVADEVNEKLRARIATLRLGDPMDKNTDIGAINSAAQLATIRALTDDRRGRGRSPLDLAVPGAGPRLLLPANGFHPGLAVDADRQGGDLRAGAVGADLPHPGRGGGQGEQHPVRAVRRGVDREGFAHPGDGLRAAGRRGLGQHLQPVRPDRRVRRVQGIRVRPGGRAGPGWPPT